MFDSDISEEYRDKYKIENIYHLIPKLMFITTACAVAGVVILAIYSVQFKGEIFKQTSSRVAIVLNGISILFFLLFNLCYCKFERNRIKKIVVPLQTAYFLTIAVIASWCSIFQTEVNFINPAVFLFVLILSSVLMSFPMYLNISVITIQEFIYLIMCFYFLSKSEYTAELKENIISSFFAFLLALYILFFISSVRKKNFLLGESIKQKMIELEAVANIDPLTGLLNRTAFDRHIRSEFERCKKEKLDFTFMLLNIDNLNSYNDHYGHLQGDNCIVRTSQTISGSLSRSSDKLFRFSETKFAVVLPGANAVGSGVVAKRIKTRMKELHIEHKGSPYKIITISTGIFTCFLNPNTSVTINEIIESADRALSEAKYSGKNRFIVYKHENNK